MITTPTEAGVKFIAKHEGFVSRAYRCPAGVVTIGYGFTNGSRVFRAFWMERHGRKLKMGDTITRADADAILRRLIIDEYGAAVAKQIAPTESHHYNGAASVAFNCGPGSLKWRWAKALAGRRVSESARLLRVTAVTANGRKLPGLVRRRDEEATVIEHARYGSSAQGLTDSAKDEVKQVQEWLNDLGYDAGRIDGIPGPRTRSAISAFQSDHDLTVDGIAGQATRAALIRKLDEQNGNTAAGGGGAVGGVGGYGEAVASDGVTLVAFLQAGAAIVVVAGLVWGGYWLYRNRGRFLNRRVPT